VNRERLLTIYSLGVGGIGWIWLLLTPQPPLLPIALLLFGTLALAVDTLSFRIPPADAHSLGGLVIITAALALGPAPGALIGAVEGLISGALLPFVYRRPPSFYLLVARPILRGGTRAAGVLLGATLASWATATPLDALPTAQPLALLAGLIIGSVLTIQLARVGREVLQGGRSGVVTWWRSTWRLVVSMEIAPLPFALLGAAIYTQLGPGYFFLTGLALIATAAAVRQATLNLATQRRSVRELALLNEVSRAIIRSELHVDALCDVIYREASKVVDTSSFHLGLFEGDTYTLVVRVQDRVRMPRLSVDLAANDGLIGWIRQTGRALLVEDFTQEMDRLPARPRYQSERPPRSGIYVPLIAGETVIGSISVQSYSPAAFTANDLRLLSLIADQAAVAFARARAFHEARLRAVQLQAIHEVSERITAILTLEELLPSVVHLIRERFQYHPVHIFTVDPNDDRIHFRATTAQGEQLARLRSLPLRVGQGVVGSAVATRAPVLVGDVSTDERYVRDSHSTRSELAVPLRIGEEVIGVLDVQSDMPNDFDTDDLFVMRTLADQIAIAIESANSYSAQQEEAWTLNALLQVAENVGRATTLSDLLATVVRLPPLLLGCKRCYCLLYERDDDSFSLQAAYGLGPEQRAALLGLTLRPAEAPLLAALHMHNAPGARPIELRAAPAHAHLWPQLIPVVGSGTLVIAPILARTSLLAALVLDYDDPQFTLNARQVNLCSGAAAQVAGALESVLLAVEADEAARLEQELRVAREIQTALLPAHLPSIAGWQVDAAWNSARLVGGDFYDFWMLHQQLRGAGGDAAQDTPVLGVVIADVSDKGVPAAMFMAMSRSLVRAAALDGSAPALAMERANRWISRDSESGMFVTLFYALLNTNSGELRYTSAGHNPPLHFHAATGALDELRTPGMALGVLEEIRLKEASTTLAPGDMLVCYTDGVTETINEALEAFEVEGLREVILRHAHESAAAMVQAILGAVSRHSEGQPAFDDVTLVVIKREPEE
jgi:serine phosphatase RsbU (regulator of sigma subunit)/putative methionine-R-sulfoxide reductase with GAF domain